MEQKKSFKITESESSKVKLTKNQNQGPVSFGELVTFFLGLGYAYDKIELGWSFSRGFDSMISPEGLYYQDGLLMISAMCHVDDLASFVRTSKVLRRHDKIAVYNYNKGEGFCRSLMTLSIPEATPVHLALREKEQSNKHIIIPVVEIGLKVLATLSKDREYYLYPGTMSLWGESD